MYKVLSLMTTKKKQHDDHLKRLLLPLIAAFVLPAAAKAESVWLVIQDVGMEKIQMKDQHF